MHQPGIELGYLCEHNCQALLLNFRAHSLLRNNSCLYQLAFMKLKVFGMKAFEDITARYTETKVYLVSIKFVSNCVNHISYNSKCYSGDCFLCCTWPLLSWVHRFFTEYWKPLKIVYCLKPLFLHNVSKLHQNVPTYIYIYINLCLCL